MNSGEESFGELVVACGDSSKVLEFVEEALDQVAFAIEGVIAGPRGFAIGLWGNHRGDPPSREGVDQRIGVIGFVRQQGLRIGAVDQGLRASQIVGLAGREHQFDGIAQGINERVDFGR